MGSCLRGMVARCTGLANLQPATWRSETEPNKRIFRHQALMRRCHPPSPP
uniref:Uncharacterized protein n=1 Tax=Arundo donax TaxID=35708 RepID=A0A0A9E883_ARUDO